MATKIKNGLRELPIDDRDFKLGFITDLPKLEDLPDEFVLPKATVRDQGNTDYCTSYACTSINELQEHVLFSPEWHFAKSKELSGDIDSWGQDLRSAIKVLTKFGSIPQEKAQYRLEDTKDSIIRDIKNWTKNTLEQAWPYRKRSYVSVEGPYSTFDNIRATIWKFRAQRRAVLAGIIWRWPLSQTRLEYREVGGYGHAITILGWSGDFLVIQNSAGITAGDQGLHYLHKDNVSDMERFGLYTVVDLTPDDVAVGIKLEDNWLIRLYKHIKSWVLELIQ